MSNEQTDNAIKERLHSIFPSNEVANKVVDLVLHKRPFGWSRKSNAPYYKEIYARQIKVVIDKMIETTNDVVYRWDTWCNNDTLMTRNTLYARVNQSIRYLIEQMDTPDHKYGKWYETVRCSREQSLGVVIRFIPGLAEGKEKFEPDEIRPKESMPEWKANLEDWLEGDDKRPFHIDKLALTSDEIIAIKNQFAQLTNVAVHVTSCEIKAIKFGD